MLILRFCCFSVPGTFLFIPYLCIFRSVCWPQNFQTRKFPYVITPKKCRWSSEKFLEDLPINKYKGYLSSDYQALTCVISMSIPIGPKTLEKESISLLHKPAKSTAALALFPIDISTDTDLIHFIPTPPSFSPHGGTLRNKPWKERSGRWPKPFIESWLLAIFFFFFLCEKAKTSPNVLVLHNRSVAQFLPAFAMEKECQMYYELSYIDITQDHMYGN